ncbi:MAG: hypothetical protein GY805_20905 [Chloroflexi bacterium]|nr:hypothetical protein [Chloroflexota bacterium]
MSSDMDMIISNRWLIFTGALLWGLAYSFMLAIAVGVGAEVHHSYKKDSKQGWP